MTQVPMTENQLGEMQMMAKVAEHVGMNYSETPDSRYMDQPFDNSLFYWEEGSVDIPITIQEDEGFSEPRTPINEPPSQPPIMETKPALSSIENLQNSSTALQPFDF